MLDLVSLTKEGVAEAQALVTARHYLRKPIDARCSIEGYAVTFLGQRVGVLLLGRPQATKCYPWYGSVRDAETGRASCTRWQVLNLARVYFDPSVQSGGLLHREGLLPGFTDRKGVFRSTLGSTTIRTLADRVVLDYLVARPPCFLEEPYELRWLLSYCDSNLHRGTLYRAAGFELWRLNAEGIETWRLPLRSLEASERHVVADASRRSERSNAYRARRAQRPLFAEAGA